MVEVKIKDRSLRIAYVGNFEPEYSTENDVRKAFEHLGHTVIKLQEGDNKNPNKASFSKVREEALSADMLLWTGTWGDAYPLQDVLDLIHECAVKNIPTATLHLDTFWSTGRGGRKWWHEPMFHTAYLFTADGDYNDKWELMGKDHMWLAPGVRFDAAKFGTEREEYKCDLAFVGSNGQGYHEDVWGYRKELVDFLRELAKRKGWTFKNPGGDNPKIERSDDMNDFYASAKVTVGDSLCLKKEDSRYWSDRVPEATGRGGFLIMPHIHAMKYNWPMMPTYDWGNYEQLEEVITHYMENDKERELIRRENQRITTAEHTYVNRVKTMLRIVGLDD